MVTNTLDMLVQQIFAYPQYLEIKFQPMIEVDSISDNVFTLFEGETVKDILLSIDVKRDYNSISRTIYLYWNENIEPDTDYAVRIAGLKNIFGEIFDTEAYTFTTPENTSTKLDLAPLQPNFYIEDYSIADVSYPTFDDSEQATPSDDLFSIIKVEPQNQIFVNPKIVDDESVFVINLKFTHSPDVTDLYDRITVQKRKMNFFYTHWEDIEPVGDPVVEDNDLSITIPAEEENYKYRIILPKTLGVSTETENHLADDYEILFTTVLTPFYSNPEEIQNFYPDVTDVEAAELIQKYSLEVKNILKLSDSSDPTFLAVEYVTAAVLCNLAKKYDDILSSNGNADDITLGDFRVSKKTGGSSGTAIRITRASAQNWCELAAAIKRELKINSRIPRHYVRSGNHKNPIPTRYFKDINTFKPLRNPIDSGLLND